MPDHPCGKDVFPNIESKPPLAQLEGISSCPLPCYLREVTDPHMGTVSFGVIESDRVPSEPPQAKMLLASLIT